MKFYKIIYSVCVLGSILGLSGYADVFAPPTTGIVYQDQEYITDRDKSDKVPISAY